MSSDGKGTSRTATQSTTSTQTVNSTINEVDNRIVDGDNARIGGNVSVHGSDNVHISTTDQGAVQAGLDIALESLGFAGNAVKATQSVASDSISQGFDLAQAARQSETSGAINNFVKLIGLVAVVGIIGWVVVRKGK